MLSASHEVRGESPRLSSNAKNFASHVTVSPISAGKASLWERRTEKSTSCTGLSMCVTCSL